MFFTIHLFLRWGHIFEEQLLNTYPDKLKNNDVFPNRNRKPNNRKVTISNSKEYTENRFILSNINISKSSSNGGFEMFLEITMHIDVKVTEKHFAKKMDSMNIRNTNFQIWSVL